MWELAYDFMIGKKTIPPDLKGAMLGFKLQKIKNILYGLPQPQKSKTMVIVLMTLRGWKDPRERVLKNITMTYHQTFNPKPGHPLFAIDMLDLKNLIHNYEDYQNGKIHSLFGDS